MPARALNAAHANDHSVRPMRLATAVRPAKRSIGVRAACNVLLSAAAGKEKVSWSMPRADTAALLRTEFPRAARHCPTSFFGAHPVRHISETGSSCLGQAERRLGDNATRSLEHDRDNSWFACTRGCLHARLHARGFAGGFALLLDKPCRTE